MGCRVLGRTFRCGSLIRGTWQPARRTAHMRPASGHRSRALWIRKGNCTLDVGSGSVHELRLGAGLYRQHVHPAHLYPSRHQGFSIIMKRRSLTVASASYRQHLNLACRNVVHVPYSFSATACRGYGTWWSRCWREPPGRSQVGGQASQPAWALQAVRHSAVWVSLTCRAPQRCAGWDAGCRRA